MKIRRLCFTAVLAMGLTLALLWALGGNSLYVRAATYTVTNTYASGPGSLRQAILNANSNAGHDTITFGAGISATIFLTDSLPAITGDLTIIGLGAEQLAVSGVGLYRVFYINSGVAVTITDLTVRDGYAPYDSGVNSASGGGIWSAGTLSLDNVWLVNNTASGGFGKGGGLYIHEGSATLNEVQAFDNEASYYGGGVFIHQGRAMLKGTQVFSNVAPQGGGGGVYVAAANTTLSGTQVFSNSAIIGGGVFVEDSATLIGTQVFGNVADNDGGGVYVDYGVATLNGTDVFSNTASQGGGIYVSVDTAKLAMSGGEIRDNVAGNHGGGVYIAEGAAVMTGTQVFSNTLLDTAGGWGGGVYVDLPTAALTMTGGVISDNAAAVGGGIYLNQGRAALHETQVLSNTAPEYQGGGVYVAQADAALTVSGGEIGYNAAGYEGGGVYVEEGSVTLSGTRVIGNMSHRGGGVFVRWAPVALNGTQVISNTAGGQGGGIFVEEGEAALTVSGGEINANVSDYGGGGMYIQYGVVTLDSVQVSHNTANSEGGGGLYVAAADVTLDGARIAANTALAGSAIYQYAGAITPTTDLTVTGNIYQANGRFVGSAHDLRIEGALTLAGGHFYAPYEPYEFVLTGDYLHTGGTYHQIKSVNDSSDVAFPKAGGLILNANGQNLGSTQIADTANGYCAGVTSGDAVRHCTLITPTLSTGRDATITFYYLSGEIPGGQQCTSMEAYRWTGAWDTMLTRDPSYGTDGRLCGSNPQSIRVMDVDAFSPFAIHQPMPADILVVPTALDFDEQAVAAGPTLAQRVTITNTGDFDLHISAVTPSGDAGEFAVTDSGEITLTPGSTRTLDIAFNPTGAGDKGAVLTITSDDSDTPSIPVVLSGRGIDCEIVVAPNSLAFGEQDIAAGPTVSQAVIITNTGSAALHITSIALTGNAPTAFVIVSGGGAVTLTTGSTHTVYVAFDPASTGAKSANLTLQSDDGDEATVNVALSGTGTGTDYKIFLPLTLRN